jgi:PAS domain S-box-containing protein
MPDQPTDAESVVSRLDEGFWRGLFDIHLNPLAIIGADYRIIRANRILAEALGCRAEELAGRYCYEVFHGGFCPLDTCPHTLLLEDGCAHAREIEINRLGGCYWVSVTPVFDDSGLLVGCLHIAQNVTAYKTLEADLRAARDEVEQRAEARAAELKEHLQFEKLLVSMALNLGRSLSDADLNAFIRSGVSDIGVTGGFGRCVFWAANGDRARVLARYEEASHLLPPLCDEATRATDGWLFSTFDGTGIAETVVGDVERYVVSLSPLLEGDTAYALVAERRHSHESSRMALSAERLLLLCHVMGDALRRQAGALEAQSLWEEISRLDQVARLGQLSAALAHELNQPLAATLCNAQAATRLLDQTPPDLSEVRSALEDIVSSARRAGDVMRQTRALFKGGAQSLQSVDPQLLVTGVLNLLRDDIALAGTEVVRKDDPLVPSVLGDSVQLQQVLINLIRNALDAVRARPEGTRLITVSTEVNTAGSVVLTVQDTGGGIVAGDEEAIFIPFRTDKPEGLGMGLPICRQIVKLHGGTIRAQRVPEGGTRLIVTLPIGSH